MWRGESPVQSVAEGLPYLENLEKAPNGSWQTKSGDGSVFGVEAFDEPLVALDVELRGDIGVLKANYGFSAHFALSSLVVDEWDRFHGHTKNGVAFVLNAKAQDHFFSQVDSYDDESFEWKGRHYSTPAWLNSGNEVTKSDFWSERYQKAETGWDLAAPSPVFVDLLPRMKMPKSRILVLGCGAGHDAHFFAQQGHLVTAVDFSAEALARAEMNYGKPSTLQWHHADVFNLPKDWQGSFDLVVEHTCYCAIEPNQRNALVQVWRKMLHEQGQLLGVFFAMDPQPGPPFGGSEWEVRQRLQKPFQFLIWNRWQKSAGGRSGKELAVLARRQ